MVKTTISYNVLRIKDFAEGNSGKSLIPLLLLGVVRHSISKVLHPLQVEKHNLQDS